MLLEAASSIVAGLRCNLKCPRGYESQAVSQRQTLGLCCPGKCDERQAGELVGHHLAHLDPAQRKALDLVSKMAHVRDMQAICGKAGARSSSPTVVLPHVKALASKTASAGSRDLVYDAKAAGL